LRRIKRQGEEEAAGVEEEGELPRAAACRKHYSVCLASYLELTYNLVLHI
jgi:hypothetical protein